VYPAIVPINQMQLSLTILERTIACENQEYQRKRKANVIPQFPKSLRKKQEQNQLRDLDE
jgi:hypothetical protein